MIDLARYKKKLFNKNIDDIRDVFLKKNELLNHAALLAQNHRVKNRLRSTGILKKRLANNYDGIFHIYKELNIIANEGGDLSPASEWLLDNFYKIEEQVKDVKSNLNNDKFIRLPTLTRGYLKGYPRTYAIALELVSHTNGKVEEETLIDFVKAYQRVSILSMSEIWSLSLMTRIALIENIRIICAYIYNTQIQWFLAEETLKLENEHIFNDIDKNIDKNFDISYIEHILAKLRREGHNTSDILDYIDLKLEEYNSSVNDVIQNEHKKHAVRRISIGNSITCLHSISTLNWNDIFESINIVEKKLRNDPAGIYAKMDFESRDYYRKTIEKISRQWNISEVKIANYAINLSNKAYKEKASEKESHVGYYLIDKGRKKLFKALKIGKDFFRLKSLKLYITSVFLFTISFTYIFLNIIGIDYKDAKSWYLVPFILITFSEPVIHFINYLFMKVYQPTLLPRFEYKDGLPKEVSTMVIIPSLLIDRESTKKLIKKMEVYYLANKDENLKFALLGDFIDSKYESTELDKEIIDEAIEGVGKLNESYSQDKDIFYYFHRKRTYNSVQKRWMGWERKRGAIIEINNLLQGKENTFFIKTGEVKNLKDLKFVITIDSDTNLKMGSAKKLIGIISHPLNRAVYDKNKEIITEGYGIIQPRIGINIEDANKTIFTRYFTYGKGIDPYTTAVSDIYQDVYGEGIFTGKGIYDLDYFNKVLESKINENTILSHDLLEGSLLRTGLATDIELIDGYPTKYKSYIMRQHRWVRGDWQLIKWLFEKKYLNPLSKWKIFDNLRRSLIYPSLYLTLIAGVLIFKVNILSLISILIICLYFPTLLSLADTFLFGRKYIVESFSLFKKSAIQLVIQLTLLAYNAYMMLDAIIRSLYRVFVSNKNLLQWVTAAEEEKKLKDSLKDYYLRMKVSYIINFIFFTLSILVNGWNTIYMLPLFLGWFFSPYIAFKISKADDKTEYILSKNDKYILKRICRKTWAYFEDFVKCEYNYLPPDNYQEYPFKGVALRTSPTNIGLYFVSMLAARDFGYITTAQLAEGAVKTLNTVERMESWKGHLYNWYDIKTLEVLRPQYISTVDSGNFVSYLLLLRQGLEEYLNKPLIDNSIIHGLADTFLMYSLEGEYQDLMSAININLDEAYPVDLLKSINEIKKNKGKIEKVTKHIENINKDINSYYISKTDFAMLNAIADDGYKKIREYLDLLKKNPSLNKLYSVYQNIFVFLEENELLKELITEETKENLNKVINNVSTLIKLIESSISKVNTIISNMEFNHLYDEKRNLFSIGFDVDKEKITNSFYDLLASEARIASYWGIVKGQVPLRHWYKLGRSLTKIDGSRALVSWTGTMFEYFMPALILKNYRGTLLSETYNAVIEAQKGFGIRQNIPWGVSESGFFSFDFNLNYQYKAFGISDLGLKRGLIEDIVISPYSTLLVLKEDPHSSIRNIKKMIELGMEGPYGLYESLDFTPKRVRKDKKREIVRSFMSHHLGMSILAFANFFYKDIMVERFHSHPLIMAGEFLIQERIPIKSVITKEYKEWLEEKNGLHKDYVEPMRCYEMPDFVPPPCHLLSNGRYSVLVNTRGEGFSKYNNIFLNRWRDDYLEKSYGNFVFIKDTNSGRVWSASHGILGTEPDGYKVVFLPSRAEYTRNDGEISSKLEVYVSPEDNVEVRRLKLENHCTDDIIFEITSYVELALTTLQDDLAHRVFCNLFIRTEYLPEFDSIIATRKSRDSIDGELYAFHFVVYEGDEISTTQYETSRENFIGRGRTIQSPALIDQPLTNTAGIVLEPCMSIRKRIKVSAGENAVITFITGYSINRSEVIDLCGKYKEIATIQRAYELSITRSQVETAYLSLSSREVLSYDNMIAHLIYKSPTKKQYENLIKKNVKGQPALWAYGISGDFPFMLVTIRQEQDIQMMIQSLKAHEYLNVKGLKMDLVILNEDESNYLQPLRNKINDVLEKNSGKYLADREKSIYVRNLSSMPYSDVLLLYASAHIILKAGSGPFNKQLKNKKLEFYKPSKKVYDFENFIIADINKEELLFSNGYGGFNLNGDEYIISLLYNTHTPAPWVNIISNKNFGFMVSESGAGYTWSENSRENKLTPWSNDPVSDDIKEVIYLNDLTMGNLWTITRQPVNDQYLCIVKHGWGYSTYKKDCYDIEHKMTVFVPLDDSIKITLIKLKNKSTYKRKIQMSYYIEPVLGVHEYLTKHHIISDFDINNDVLILKNNYNSDFSNRLAFMFSSEKIKSYSGDKIKFLGMDKNKEHPLGLTYKKLDNCVGVNSEPCGVIQIEIDIEPGEEKEMAFCFGQTLNKANLDDYIARYYRINYIKSQFNKVKGFWKDKTDVLKIKTPDKSMDLLINGWLVYQTLACRIWGRTAFYQSGGAYGFRDQLQDSINMAIIQPELLKKQILLCARQQFKEGDVLHWWHPLEKVKGVRTRFSDDLLWLPYAVIQYIGISGDYSILNDEEAFLESEALKDGEDEKYITPSIADEKATIYEHCNRAIERSLKFGSHGLPLMGSGDWNDGMNKVANEGKGESVWLAFFLYSILINYEALCVEMDDLARAERYKDIAIQLKDSIESNGWDGNWYKRAYYDDGTPLGSSENSECMIDSIVQSWAVLSKAGDEDRCKVAMDSLKRYLVKEDEGIILLFTPPFDIGNKNPGYIKSYVPGVRENGGQYTHAASWVICAFAELGHGNTAWQLFNMINPINHTQTLKECSIYKTEPYVMAADVYSLNPHAGRGGWSWYTGAAGWFYQAGLKYILGFNKYKDRLVINPCIPNHWKEYQINYKYKSAEYIIKVTNPDSVNTGIKSITLDGILCLNNYIQLIDDGKTHEISIVMGLNENFC